MNKIICILVVIFAMTSCNPKEKRSIKLQNGDEWFIVSDRNAGVNVPSPEEVSIALNWINGVHTEDGNPENFRFKGDYYTWAEAMAGKNSDGTDMCPSGWRLPSKSELEVINSTMQFSDGKAYLEKSDGNRCYFPLSGASDSPSLVYGFCWSNTEYEDSENVAWGLHVHPSNSRVSFNFKSYGYSVRCVKTVPL